MYCSFPLFTTQSLLLFNVCKNIKIKLTAKNMTTSISKFVLFLVIYLRRSRSPLVVSYQFSD